MCCGIMEPTMPRFIQRSKASGPGCKRRRNCQVLIVNADDFGRSPGINAATIRAHREGVLTSASLMVTGEALDEAVALARETPSLAVGLHLVTVGGPAVLPAYEIPHLVDNKGCFPNDPFRSGVRYFFSTAARRELGQELAAQFERFAATGIPLSHVDGHLNMHVHPTIFDLLLPLAEAYEAHGLRLPRDDLWLSLGYDRRRPGTKVLWAIVFGLLSRRCLDRLRDRRLAVAHRVYGLMQSGHMQESYVIGLLRSLRVPTAEIYFHPDLDARGEVLGPNPGDLATLLSPSIRQVIREHGMRLATYATLVEDEGK
jgi:hopanoid biosynthesis associated protein HpnK